MYQWLIIVSLLIFGCGKQQDEQLTDSYQEGLKTITTEDVTSILQYLTSTDLEGRKTGTAGEMAAVTYIASEFSKYNLKQGAEKYIQPFKYSSVTGHNVIGYIEGSEFKDQYLVVGAHLDHLGKNYPGADDNASGTTALLEVAQALSTQVLKRNVIFVAFSGEEEGLIGSTYYVDNAKTIDNTTYMVNLDMIGYLRSGTLYAYGTKNSSYVTSVLTGILKNYPTIKPKISGTPTGGSDHVPFNNSGIGTTFFHTGLHANYHKPTDTAEKINYNGVRDISKITYELVYQLANGNDIAKEKNNVIIKSTKDHDAAKFPALEIKK